METFDDNAPLAFRAERLKHFDNIHQKKAFISRTKQPADQQSNSSSFITIFWSSNFVICIW